MGEELKEGKMFFITENGEYKELKKIQNLKIEPISTTDEDMNEENFLENKLQGGLSFTFELSNELWKQYRKIIGEAPLSKKRTRKLLMAHGFDRDTAQMYADTMKPRNMNAIEEVVNDVRCIRF